MKIESTCVPEIAEAIDMLKDFESQLPDVSNIDLFVFAIEILNEYVEDNPSTPYKNFIHNIKLSYTRRILQHLKLIDTSEVDTWFIIVLVLAIVSEEVEALSTTKPVYREEYDDFLREWAGTYQLKQLMAGVSRKSQNTARA